MKCVFLGAIGNLQGCHGMSKIFKIVQGKGVILNILYCIGNSWRNSCDLNQSSPTFPGFADWGRGGGDSSGKRPASSCADPFV